MPQLKILYCTNDRTSNIIRSGEFFKQEVMKQQDVLVFCLDEEANIKQILYDHEFTPDFIFFDDVMLNKPLHGLKYVNIPKGVLYWDLQKDQKKFRRFVYENDIDLIFSFHRDAFIDNFPELLNKFRWLPHHVNIQQFKDYDLNRKIDFLLMGAVNEDYYPLRHTISTEMKGYPGFVHHPHPGYRDYDRDEDDEAESLVGEYFAREINKAKMFFTDDSIYRLPNAKYFEVPACRTLLLANGSKELRDLGFIDGETFVEVNEENYLEKALYYLEHEEERTAIAERGYQMVRKKHSTTNRVLKFINYIRDYLDRIDWNYEEPVISLSPQRLHSGEVMDKVIYALDNKIPYAVVSVGETEAFVMAQYYILSEEEFMNNKEATIANEKIERGHQHRGILFPNTAARDMAIDAVKICDIVGYNTFFWKKNAGQFTEKVFDTYDIWRKYYFEAYIRRVIIYSQEKKFHQMLRGKNILIVCGYAKEVKKSLNANLKADLNFNIVGTVMVNAFEDLPRAMEEIAEYEFDLALLAAGTNAIILAGYIKENLGKVAFDLGHGMESIARDYFFDEKDFIKEYIGINRLMNM
ncbi:GT-D fold domain-containing glycosyltransferase [Paenibacillus radicis (ex Xue et al. 2023)]|uniref:GT-D fold domain-containing glycosyltransferase n=1 Tax=Paenibacillus radicis (ex Xue et al. 2023) TaxID=2972489 RepID=A0ABT1YH28_9BACL|nr:GT-D fold domain-containing glycosyltransferase [Paenibacillus radicis (ex Xue et al. 2023)]MCR8632482.1 GT-D fold domain-containing glycosyltransferase [Paenibacillus radicis (ex Xue et al. 2023)]